MKLGEPAIDLGIVVAIISSYKNRTVDPDTLISARWACPVKCGESVRHNRG